MVLAVVEHGPASIEKPPEVSRGQSSRLPWVWDGLCFAVPFNDATRDSARDLVVNAAPSEWLGNPSFTKDNRGNVAALMPNDAYVGYANNPAHNRPTTAVTAYLRFRRTGTTPVGVGFFAKVHTAGADPYTTWGMQTTDLDGAKLAASITVGGTNYYWENSGYTTDTNTWISVFLRWTTGTTPVQDVLGERGQSYSTVSHGTVVSGSLTYNTVTPQPIRINTADFPPPNNPTYLGAYSQAMVWSRRLSNTEMQALVADPYGWYSPRRETVILSGPFPIVWANTFQVSGYAMFATTAERDALRAELQAWLDRHTASDVWASPQTLPRAGGDYDLPAGFDTPDLMDEADPPGGPWPGLTWSFEVAGKELRDSFGAVPGLGAAWAGALEGSQFGEVTS